MHERVKKLECMAHAWQCDTRIGGYPIPFCCEPTTLSKMYTMEELCAASVINAVTNPEGGLIAGLPAGSEFEESDITDTKGICDVVEESTDTEMARQAHPTLMITTDREKLWLDALIKEQDCAMAEAVR